MKKSARTVYLDHAATTYLDPGVFKAMEPFWLKEFGNPSSLYALGIKAKQAKEGARNRIAKILNCKPDEIIFTAGGTESVNLAIFGVARKNTKYKQTKNARECPHIITTKIEHHAVLHSVERLQQEGIEATYVPVDKFGFVRADDIIKAIRPSTVLISIMYANNEIGTIEPIADIGRALKKINAERGQSQLPKIYFHTDACQAGGVCDLYVNHLGVDLMTLNGSKLYGPKQTGLLYIKSGTGIEPLIYGGGQEQGLRSGTENVPGIVGLATALDLAQKNRIKENKRVRQLRDGFIGDVMKVIPKAQLNGPDERKLQVNNKILRLPNNVNLSFPGIEGEALMLYLDAAGICVSTGSACNSNNFNPSHVLMAIGKSLLEARGTIRITLGKRTTKKDLDYTLNVLKDTVTRLQRVKTI